jgi:hypothetical protein
MEIGSGEPTWTGKHVILRLAGIQKHGPLGVHDEFQLCVLDCCEDRFAIHGQKDRRTVVHENEWRVVFQVHRLDGLGFGNIGDYAFEGDVEHFRNEVLEELLHLC